MGRNIIFQGISTDKGKRIITGKVNGDRVKYRLDANKNLNDAEQVDAVNKIASSIKTHEDLEGYIALSETRFGYNLREEIKLVAKAFAKKEKNFQRYCKEKDIDKYIFVGDIKSGKSYLIANLLAEVLAIDITDREKLKNQLIKILSGIGETTVTLNKFSIRKSSNKSIEFNCELVDDTYIDAIVYEALDGAYEKIKKNEQKGEQSKIILKYELNGNIFRLNKLLGKEKFLDVNDKLIAMYLKNKNITKDEYIRVTKGIIEQAIEESSNEIKLKIEQYRNEKVIDNDKFLEILKYISNKKISSLLKAVDFKIIKESIEKEFDLVDSIGLNHGEGTNKLDVNKIRDLRVSDIINKYPDYNIIYTINSSNTTNLTLQPINSFDRMGILNKVKFVVTQLDILSEEYEFYEFIEEKIEEKLEVEIIERLKENIQAGPLEIKDLFINQKSNHILKYKNILNDINIRKIAKNTINKFENDINTYFNDIHWNRMNAISRNESIGKDEYLVGGTLEFSITHLFIVNLLNELDNDKFKSLFRIKDNVKQIELDAMKNKFKKKLFNSIKAYYVLLNIRKYKKIYDLRWNSEYREYFNISMTQERALKFKKTIFEKCSNMETIIELIQLAAEDNNN